MSRGGGPGHEVRPGTISMASPVNDSLNSDSLQVRWPSAGSFRYHPSFDHPSTTRKWLRAPEDDHGHGHLLE